MVLVTVLHSLLQCLLCSILNIHQLSRNSFNKASNFVHAIGLVNKSTIYHSETLNIGHLKPDEGDFEFHALMCFVKKKLSDDAKSIIAWTSSVPTYQQRAAVYPRANICMSHSYSLMTLRYVIYRGRK